MVSDLRQPPESTNVAGGGADARAQPQLLASPHYHQLHHYYRQHPHQQGLAAGAGGGGGAGAGGDLAAAALARSQSIHARSLHSGTAASAAAYSGPVAAAGGALGGAGGAGATSSSGALLLRRASLRGTHRASSGNPITRVLYRGLRLRVRVCRPPRSSLLGLALIPPTCLHICPEPPTAYRTRIPDHGPRRPPPLFSYHLGFVCYEQSHDIHRCRRLLIPSFLTTTSPLPALCPSSVSLLCPSLSSARTCNPVVVIRLGLTSVPSRRRSAPSPAECRTGAGP